MLPARIAQSSGPTYYVAPTGSDSTGTGTWLSPWGTIEHALLSVPAGSTIELVAGTYIQSPGDIEVFGTSEAPIAIRARGGFGSVKVKGWWSFQDGAAYIRVDGIEIDADSTEVAGLVGAVPLRFADGCHHIEFVNGSVHDGDASCIITENDSDHVHLINVRCFRSGRLGEATHNLHHGIYMSGSNHLALNCLIHDNDAMGLQFYESAQDCLVSHCTIVGNGRAGVIYGSGDGVLPPSSNNGLVNCIITTNGTWTEPFVGGYGINTSWGSSGIGAGNWASHNLIYGNQVSDTRITGGVDHTPFDLGDDGVERVLNGSFETDLAGWSDDAFVTVVPARSSTWSSAGGWSQRMQWTDSTPNRNNGRRTATGLGGVPVSAEQRINLRVEVNVISAPTAGTGPGQFLRAYFYDTAGNYVIDQSGPQQAGLGLQTLEAVVTAPADGFFAVGVYGNSGTNNGGVFDAYFDQVSAKFTPTPDAGFLAIDDFRIGGGSAAIDQALSTHSPDYDLNEYSRVA